MNAEAIVTFVVIAGLVWGGFILLVVKAMRSERFKSTQAAEGEGAEVGGSTTE